MLFLELTRSDTVPESKALRAKLPALSSAPKEGSSARRSGSLPTMLTEEPLASVTS